MNKGRREELAKLKHKKRCLRLGIKPEENYCFKNTGTPCSCSICKNEKYNRKKKHKGNDEDFN